MNETPQEVSASAFVTEPPPVNPAAVNSGEPTSPSIESPPSPAEESERDDKGTPFDPERHIHAKHPRTGCWMPKRRASTANAAGYVAPDPQPPAPPPPPSEYRMAAEGACQITYALGMMLGGDEWTPTEDDHARLLPAWESYLQTKGMKDVPPGVALAIAMIAYASPRFRKPKTLSTLAKLRIWWINRKTNAAARRAADAVDRTQAATA